MGFTRREFLKGAAALAAGSAAPARATAGEGTRIEEPVFRVPGLHPALDGLRVAQLSDVHCGASTPPERILDAVRRANALRPDLIVLTGDYLARQRRGVALVRSLLAGFAAPTVAVLGNHDHWVDPGGAARALASHGYAVLRNQHTTLTLRGEPFTVIGIDDLLTGHARPEQALAGAGRGSRIALAHGPRTADLLRQLGEPLVCFAGHTHGGQINVPGLTRFMLRAFAREPYARGAFRLGPVQLYVNRGLGNSALRIRVDSDPELTLATLRCAERAPAPPQRAA
jgi:predicted MPP superfamily phosphohydrolase